MTFLNIQIRTSGEPASNIEILKYSKLFEDEITLDNLKYSQLAALCRLLEIPTVGPSALLRFQLWLKLRQLEADDRVRHLTVSSLVYGKADLSHNTDRHFDTQLKTNQITFLPSGLLCLFEN